MFFVVLAAAVVVGGEEKEGLTGSGSSAAGGTASITAEGGASDDAPAISTLVGCRALCADCGLDTMVNAGSCADFCADLDRQAVAAECDGALDDFVACRNGRTDACSLRSCPNETNNLTVCVLTYCDDHSVSSRALCSPW